jgi:hypothetical protein
LIFARLGRPLRLRQVGAEGTAFGTDRLRGTGLLGRRRLLTRAPARIGALNAVSTFIRSHAVARLDRFVGCTTTPYCGPVTRY